VDESSSSGEERRDACACQSERGRFRLTKEARIRSSSDYRRIIQQGTKYRTPHFHIRMLENRLGIARLGIAAGRKAGNACERNRIKRRLREYFRLNRDKIPRGTDLVFIALGGAAAANTNQLFAELNRFFEKEFGRGPRGPLEG
jgi:ribonuclease P protein component